MADKDEQQTRRVGMGMVDKQYRVVGTSEKGQMGRGGIAVQWCCMDIEYWRYTVQQMVT